MSVPVSVSLQQPGVTGLVAIEQAVIEQVEGFDLSLSVPESVSFQRPGAIEPAVIEQVVFDLGATEVEAFGSQPQYQDLRLVEEYLTELKTLRVHQCRPGRSKLNHQLDLEVEKLLM